MINIRKKSVFCFSLNAVFLSDKKDKTVFFKSNEHFFGMSRGKQTVKKVIWRIGGRYK